MLTFHPECHFFTFIKVSYSAQRYLLITDDPPPIAANHHYYYPLIAAGLASAAPTPIGADTCCYPPPLPADRRISVAISVSQ